MDTGVDGGRRAAGRAVNHTDIRRYVSRIEDRARTVLTTIVHDDDFERPVTTLCKDSVEHCGQPSRAIPHRNDNADAVSVLVRR
jgi:hypothetical protein